MGSAAPQNVGYDTKDGLQIQAGVIYGRQDLHRVNDLDEAVLEGSVEGLQRGERDER